MGTWGTGLYSDDLAADLRGDFRDLLGEGIPANVAIDRLLSEYAESLADPDEAPVFWLALADLARWESARDRARREAVLAKLRTQLLSPQPAAKRVPKTVTSANEWVVGDVIAFQLLSGRWVPMRVIGHHTDKGGRFAVCELLDWIGETIPSAEDIGPLAIRRERGPRGVSQFLFQEPKTAKDQKRVVRTGVMSAASQRPGEYIAFVWPHVDRLMREVFERD